MKKTVQTLEKNGNWKGGKLKDNRGYVIVRKGSLPKDHKGSRYAMQHRLVMEKHLGRPLARNEVVYHLNGDRADNRLRNLRIHTRRGLAKQDLTQVIHKRPVAAVSRKL